MLVSAWKRSKTAENKMIYDYGNFYLECFFRNFRGRPIGGSVMHVIGRQGLGLFVTVYNTTLLVT
jgi:hypothetical protein